MVKLDGNLYIGTANPFNLLTDPNSTMTTNWEGGNCSNSGPTTTNAGRTTQTNNEKTDHNISPTGGRPARPPVRLACLHCVSATTASHLAESPICGRAFRFIWASGDGYLAAALALPISGTTPSCCISPRASQLTQPSTILPLEKRAMLIPVMVNCFPVGAIPPRSPL